MYHLPKATSTTRIHGPTNPQLVVISDEANKILKEAWTFFLLLDTFALNAKYYEEGSNISKGDLVRIVPCGYVPMG